MQAKIVFLGDELSAAGFRLAGLTVRVPPAGEERKAFTAAVAEAELILISAGLAERLPHAVLEKAMAAPLPLVCVLPEVTGHKRPEDLAACIRARLGIAEVLP